MKKPYFFTILFILLIACYIFPSIGKFQTSNHSKIKSHSLEICSCYGNGSIPQEPFLIQVDTPCGGEEWDDYFRSTDVRYLAFEVEENQIYYLYAESYMYWSFELYNDPNYTALLGTPYIVGTNTFTKYLIFSPNRTGPYYMSLSQNIGFGGISFQIITADYYTLNSSEVVIIGSEEQPVEIFQIDAEEGNYSSSPAVMYAKTVRGWNYVIFPEMYSTFPPDDRFYLDGGTYTIIIEESCQFQLISYPSLNESSTNPPIGENTTDTGEKRSIFEGVTPIFGIGALLGICVVYKMKNKK